jgi:hypothetical protein
MGFVKLHEQIFQSSIVEEDIVTRWVWICLLLLCDKNGNIYGTRAALARQANVEQFELDGSLHVLMAPDPDSTSKEEGGRRIIEAGPNLLHCVNYRHYRGLKDPDEEKEKIRLRVAKHRAKKKEEERNDGNKNVTESNPIAESRGREQKAEAESPPKPPSRGAEIDSEPKPKKKRFIPPTRDEVIAYISEKDLGLVDADVFISHYESNGWRVGKNKMQSWKSAITGWNTRSKNESSAARQKRPSQNIGANSRARTFDDF